MTMYLWTRGSRYGDAQRAELRAALALFSVVDLLLLAMPRTRAKRQCRFAWSHRNPYRKLSTEEIEASRLKYDSRVRFSMT